MRLLLLFLLGFILMGFMVFEIEASQSSEPVRTEREAILLTEIERLELQLKKSSIRYHCSRKRGSFCNGATVKPRSASFNYQFEQGGTCPWRGRGFVAA